jgi:hypothetical protein
MTDQPRPAAGTREFPRPVAKGPQPLHGIALLWSNLNEVLDRHHRPRANPPAARGRVNPVWSANAVHADTQSQRRSARCCRGRARCRQGRASGGRNFRIVAGGRASSVGCAGSRRPGLTLGPDDTSRRYHVSFRRARRYRAIDGKAPCARFCSAAAGGVYRGRGPGLESLWRRRRKAGRQAGDADRYDCIAADGKTGVGRATGAACGAGGCGSHNRCGSALCGSCTGCRRVIHRPRTIAAIDRARSCKPGATGRTAQSQHRAAQGQPAADVARPGQSFRGQSFRGEGFGGEGVRGEGARTEPAAETSSASAAAGRRTGVEADAVIPAASSDRPRGALRASRRCTLCPAGRRTLRAATIGLCDTAARAAAANDRCGFERPGIVIGAATADAVALILNCHRPRKRAIQYSRDADDEVDIGRGVLDRPVIGERKGRRPSDGYAGRRRAEKGDRLRGRSYPSNTASAPLTASALSITVRSSEPACTEIFSAKNRASVT